MVRFLIIFLIFNFSLKANEVTSEKRYNSANKDSVIKEKAFSLLYDYIIENKLNLSSSLYYVGKKIILEDKKFVFKEKKINIEKSQDRVTLQKYINGYLGAKFHNSIKMIPYAYAYIIKHSSGDVLKNYYENNKIEKIVENKKKGYITHLNIDNRMIFKRLSENKYEILVSYTVLDQSNNRIRFRSKYKANILNRKPFDFQIYDEETKNI